MGQYKVPQNVEAEDKILGPLTIKQFIYVIIALMWGFIAIRLLAPFNLIVGIILALPVSGTLLALGLIQREGVSFENYFLAFIRFNLYPRKRQWQKDANPDVIKNEPKKAVVPELHKSLNQGQLKQLAFIVDTRGNYKDPNLQLPDSSNIATQMSSRVVGPQAAQGEIPNVQPLMPSAPQAAAQVSAPQATPAQTAQAQPGVAPIATQPAPQPPAATAQDDVLDETSTQSTDVGTLLQNVEVNLRNRTVAKMKQSLTAAPKTAKTAPTLTSDRANAQVAAATASQATAGGTLSGNQVATALARLSQQSDHLSVQRLAAQADKAIPLSEGQVVQVRG
ncbi:PrgI family protein [Candidatus Saccharibacteria bacterium]|nr:PrgI family protein [Candidatus Saccharibacteria bacterium]